MTDRPMQRDDLQWEVDAVLGGWHEIPARGRRNTAPKRLLEYRLDAEGWNIRCAKSVYRITLFSRAPDRQPDIREMVRRFGGRGRNGNAVFRHIARNRPAHRDVEVTGDGVVVLHPDHPDIRFAWGIDNLENHAASKLGRLVVASYRLHGDGRLVMYLRCDIYSGFRFDQFLHGLLIGEVFIEFDIRMIGERISPWYSFSTSTRYMRQMYDVPPNT